MSRRLGNLSMSVLSTTVALALPKCPMCVVGFLTLLSALGVSSTAYTAHLPAFTGICLCLTVVSFALPLRNRQLISPLPLGLAASIAIWLGKFALTSDTLFYGGVALLVSASVWNLWRGWTAKEAPCCAGSSHTTALPLPETSIS